MEDIQGYVTTAMEWREEYYFSMFSGMKQGRWNVST
jgi:hypothetical protein